MVFALIDRCCPAVVLEDNLFLPAYSFSQAVRANILEGAFDSCTSAVSVAEMVGVWWFYG